MASCKGICVNYTASLKKLGVKKYADNNYCKQCDKWMSHKDVLLMGIYHRCPCCHMKVRTKRWSSKGSRNK